MTGMLIKILVVANTYEQEHFYFTLVIAFANVRFSAMVYILQHYSCSSFAAN